MEAGHVPGAHWIDGEGQRTSRFGPFLYQRSGTLRNHRVGNPSSLRLWAIRWAGNRGAGAAEQVVGYSELTSRVASPACSTKMALAVWPGDQRPSVCRPDRRCESGAPVRPGAGAPQGRSGPAAPGGISLSLEMREI